MAADRNVEFVRSLWAATHRRGIAPALQLVDSDAAWALHFAPERIFDTEELRDFLGKVQGDRELLAAQLLRVRSQGDVVLGSGSFRWGSIDGGLSDFQGHWVYEFKDGRLVCGRSYRTFGEALEAFEVVHERSRSTSSAE